MFGRRSYPGVLFSFVALIAGLAACTSQVIKPQVKDIYTYLYLGHTYQWGSSHEDNRIDHRLETHDFGQYDGLLLGGDLCTETSKFRHTVEYLNDLFQLSKPTTLWSVGNHDVRNGNLHFIRDATGRSLHYSTSHHDVVWVVLNSAIGDYPDQTDACHLKTEQLAMFHAVFDTITPGQNVILMVHHVVWTDVESGMRADTAANADRRWINFACDSVVRFTSHLYPVLSSHAATGADVFVLSGDGGQYKKTYEYVTGDGVTFLISGINNSVWNTGYRPDRPFNPDPDSVLLITNDRLKGSLTYQFVKLTELLE